MALPLSLSEALQELKKQRQFLQAQLSANSDRMRQLNMENQQLRIEKKSLLDYIKELEKFSVDKIDIKELKKIIESRIEP